MFDFTRLAFALFFVVAGPALAQETNRPAPAPASEVERLTYTVSTGAVYTPDGQSILFATNRTSRDVTRYDIWRMNADGSQARPIISDVATDEEVSVSPDGARIAFRSNRHGNPEIYLADIDGSNVRRITDHPERDIRPQWSRDGAELLFNSARDYADPHGQQFELYSVRLSDGRLRRLTHDGALNTIASYSPDGRHILLRKQIGENSEIFVMDANGRRSRNLTNHPAYDSWPTWSPDGRQIVFSSNRGADEAVYEVYVMNVDGGELRQVTSLGARSGGAVFSPDGGSILFTRTGGGYADLFRVPASMNASAPTG